MTNDEKFPQAQTCESPLRSVSPYQRFSIPGILIRFRLKSDIPLSEKNIILPESNLADTLSFIVQQML